MSYKSEFDTIFGAILILEILEVLDIKYLILDRLFEELLDSTRYSRLDYSRYSILEKMVLVLPLVTIT